MFLKEPVMRIRAREPQDSAEVERLLADSGLPSDGLEATTGWVLLHDGRIHGHIALECAGDATVLRSLAVSKQCQGRGYGRALLDFAEAALVTRGPGLRVLRTDSIGDWVLRRGYRPARLGDLPAPVRGTTQFSGGLCASTPVYVKEN
jgi:N-acetylglutamate synthase-like GNAT family acetyltransferase